MIKPVSLTIAGLAAATAALGFAIPASAHVVVSGTDATQGGWGVLTFRVPTESETASTTDLLVTLPDDQPIVSVSTQPKPGWTTTVTKKKLTTPQKDDDGNLITDYVSTIEWKANDPQAGIPPHQFDMFNVSAGPLPNAEMIYLPTTQTYSDGTVVNWNQKAPMGQPEPEHPAPMLMLAASGGESAGTSAVVKEHPGSTLAWPGIAALAVGTAALLLGIVNLITVRRKGS